MALPTREQTSVGTQRFLAPKESPRFKQDGNCSNPGATTLRPRRVQTIPSTLDATQTGKIETMFYNISLIAGQIVWNERRAKLEPSSAVRSTPRDRPRGGFRQGREIAIRSCAELLAEHGNE